MPCAGGGAWHQARVCRDAALAWTASEQGARVHTRVCPGRVGDGLVGDKHALWALLEVDDRVAQSTVRNGAKRLTTFVSIDELDNGDGACGWNEHPTKLAVGLEQSAYVGSRSTVWDVLDENDTVGA